MTNAKPISTPVGACCKAIRGVNFPSGHAKSEPFADSILCLTTSAVQESLDWSTGRYIPVDAVRSNDQVLQVRDLLVSTANSKQLVGKLSVVRELPLRATFGAFVTVLRANENVNADYLAFALKSDKARAYFYSKSSETTGISNLRIEDLFAYQIPLPPVAEQERIAARLGAALAQVDAARRAAEEHLALIEALPAALLREAFGGHEG